MSSGNGLGEAKVTGSWAARPPGVPGAVLPSSVPLSFLGAASAGLIACSVAWIWVRSAAAVTPNSDPVIAAVHFGVLATLTMGILGATHQFTPVITGRPLRSVLLARATFLVWLAASWALPLGIGFENVGVTAASGALALLGLVLLAWNLAAPLSARGKGAPVTALRLALLGAAATTLLGGTFVGDRQGNWFVLSAHVDLAMGVLGLFAWLGVTYIGVAQKLWPMFMLAHLPGQHRAGTVAVLATWLGAAVVAGGLALVGALVLPHHYRLGVALVAAAMVASGDWLLEALVGHAHKVVPFIVWSLLRSAGARSGPSGKPLMFADLYHHGWAWLSGARRRDGVTTCPGATAPPPTSARGPTAARRPARLQRR